METHQKKLGRDYHRLKTMVKRSIEQEIRNKKRSEIITALQLGSQIYSYTSSYENPSSKSSSGQGMGKIGKNFGVELDESQK